ncbi:hypothetical protein [Niabella beijingensis]|uniref:hypothetical protein n=1 Tax=Niabella beijingensis TaxID=2872700 RepID=UPI001CC16076|nr:hypothetical protein [Niabella beijingensis]MBZ4191323.1 hypothetical protein [Niabella beijingensis]
MKLPSLLVLSIFLLTSCSKPATLPEKPKSTITVKKNDMAWVSEGVAANYNVDEDRVHVMSGRDNETFMISFKKGGIPIDGFIRDFSASVFIAPFKGSAAISESYRLDSTKPNKLKLLLFENPEKRIACDFVLYFKKEGPASEETNVFQGRFDVRYDIFSLK